MFVCVLGEAIGSPSTLPYLSPELRGENLLVGANFASAGIGILNDTGIQFVSFISFCSNFPTLKMSSLPNDNSFFKLISIFFFLTKQTH